jgi:transcriptional regulator with AAA-type ATPase domain
MHQISSESYHQKIRILGIAPYEGMKSIMQKIAAERPEIELDVFVGDLQKGVEITKHNSLNNYDVIISRGGTAELIGQNTHIPVIEVKLSFYDILRAIKLSENYSDRYAIVGFPGITSSAHLLCDLLQYHIDIFTIHSQDEVQDTLMELKEKGYKMVLCDMITDTMAKRLGLNAILITSGAESISNAFDQAVHLISSCADIKAENQFFSDILRNAGEHTIVIKENGEIFFSTQSEEEFAPLYETLVHEIPAILDKRTQKFFKNIDGILYSFVCKKLSFQGDNYAAFYFSSNPVPFVTSKYGIQYSNQQEAEDHFFNSFYSLTNATKNMQTTIEHINQTSFPVMLSGESGSGKEQVARDIYSKSRFSGNPLITVDCAQLNDRSWNFLTNHYNSPFNDNNNTIFLKDITVLTKERRQQLLSLIIDTNLCKRNRMIFSCTCPLGQGIPAEAMEFVNQLSCLTLHLPPLREHVSELPALASLYLNTINVSTASQIIGLEPDALELLQNYHWPYNYTQFKRILNELALVTTTPYIQAEHVAALLEKEKEQTTSAMQPSVTVSGQEGLPDGFHTLDLSRPLDEITQEIIRLVMADCGGKQSAAAKSLGIGRSTIWRYLK